jgi:hypothetical protein
LIKNIHTLMGDINDLIERNDGWFTPELSEEFSRELGQRLVRETAPRSAVPSLRLSQMGPRCPRSLWASIHSPGIQEPLPAQARIKFTYGHLIEALAISMAKAAGHEVTGEQDELVVDGVKGHRDCIIDGCIVDVKSCSSLSFLKFKDGSIRESDTFGYLDQLDGYLVGSLEDPLVRVKDRAYLWAIDKQLGRMCLYEHRLRKDHILQRVASYKQIVSEASPPRCTCGVISDGQSGNLRLDVKASYNSFKYFCFPDLRTFLCHDGPRYLVKTVRPPKRRDGSTVPEVDRLGNLVV